MTVTLRRGVLLCIVGAVACGARSDLRFEGGDGVHASTSSAATGGAPPCADMTFAGDRSGAVGLALDATHAYWVTPDGNLERGALASGASEVVGHFESSEPLVLDLSDSHVYVGVTDRLIRVPKTGGPSEIVASGHFAPYDIEVDGDAIWLFDASGSVYRWRAADGLVSLVNGLTVPGFIAVDAADVYVAAFLAMINNTLVMGALLRIAKDGGAPDVLASRFSYPFGVRVDASHVYWGTRPDGSTDFEQRLWSRSKSGGAPTQLATVPLHRAVAFVIDDAFAYVTVGDHGDLAPYGGLFRVPLAGGIAEPIYERQGVHFAEAAVSATSFAVAVYPPAEDPTAQVNNVEVFCKRLHPGNAQ